MNETIINSIEVSYDGPMDAIRDRAVELEEFGCTGLWTAETEHDAFLQCALALMDTKKMTAATGIVIALARSPMTIAQQAVDLQDLSKGRFLLGLGSQIKPHIIRRFSMPWHKPVPQMREMVQAIRAIFDHWYDGEPLNYLGEYYQLTFNSTAFRRQPRHAERPPILLAAVGEKMLAMASNQADGLISHPFTNEKYLRDVVQPVLVRGERSASGSFNHVVSPNVVIDDGSDDLERKLNRVRERMALYGSTPAYRGVLDVHGLGDLHQELNRLSRENAWKQMGELIDDDVLDLFCVHGGADSVARKIIQRFGDLATTLRLPYHARAVVPELQMQLGLKITD